jgi:hypothetical protein
MQKQCLRKIQALFFSYYNILAKMLYFWKFQKLSKNSDLFSEKTVFFCYHTQLQPHQKIYLKLERQVS